MYAAADAAVAEAGPRCEASGRCCRFTEYGHTLFLSRFEADILLETAPAYDQPVSRDGCPFQIDGLCTAREQRPIGCRVYFCDPTYQERMSEIIETAIAELKRIADDAGAGWDYAPLHKFLNNDLTPQPPLRSGEGEPASTSPLEGGVGSLSEPGEGSLRTSLPLA